MTKTIQVQVLEKISPNKLEVVGMTTATVTDIEKEKEKRAWQTNQTML